MKNLITFVVIFGLLACGLGYWYLSNHATKADIYSIEKTYNVHLPLWMKELPQATGNIEDMYAQSKAQFSGDLEARKASAKGEFNIWLSGLQTDIKEAARQKAQDMVDAKFGTGK